MPAALLLAAALGDTISIAGPASCPRCRIVPKPMAVLGPVDGILLDYGAFSFVRLKDGRFLVTGFARPGTIAVFGSDGRWQRDLGRRGGGPGEYQNPVRLSAWVGDSILVLDAGLSRVSVLGPDLRFARLFPLTVPHTRLLGLPGGTIVLSSPPGSERGMTALDPAGRPIAAFGPTVDPNGLDFQRELTRGPSGTVLTGRVDRYDIEEFTTRGEARRLVRRPVPWFPPADSRHLGDEAVEPTPPASAGILSGGDGLVWHLTAVTRMPFKAPVIRGVDGKNEVDMGLLLAGKDTRVELLDLRKGQVVASGTATGLLWPGDTSPLVARLHDDASRGPVVEILELKVEPPNR